MRKNFLPFSCGARNATYMQRSSKALPTTDTLNTKEDEFIAGGRKTWEGMLCGVGLKENLTRESCLASVRVQPLLISVVL
jgi:hypothetical protein